MAGRCSSSSATARAARGSSARRTRTSSTSRCTRTRRSSAPSVRSSVRRSSGARCSRTSRSAASSALHPPCASSRPWSASASSPRTIRSSRSWSIGCSATGHGVAWLKTPAHFNNLVDSGPLHDLTQRLVKDLISKGKCSIVVVSLPERLVVRETLELITGRDRARDRPRPAAPRREPFPGAAVAPEAIAEARALATLAGAARRRRVRPRRGALRGAREPRARRRSTQRSATRSTRRADAAGDLAPTPAPILRSTKWGAGFGGAPG